MSKFSLRLPDDLYERIQLQAKRQGVSVNQFLLQAASQAVTWLEAKEFFERRARSFDEERFRTVLEKVADRAPSDPKDRM